MPLQRISCPECGAGLKSPTGFEPGQPVTCPKCESDFTVEDPEAVEAPKRIRAAAIDNEEPGDRPKKRKKRRDDEDARSYKNSPLRYAILAVLIIVMLVLGYMLYEKKRREAAAANEPEEPEIFEVVPRPQRGPAQLRQPGQAPAQRQQGGKAFVAAPKTARAELPFVGATPDLDTPEGQRIITDLSVKLIGAWEGTAPDGALHSIDYKANGQFTHRVVPGPEPTSGVWFVMGLVGTRGLKVMRDDRSLPFTLVFEGDELLHDSPTPGLTLVLRRK